MICECDTQGHDGESQQNETWHARVWWQKESEGGEGGEGWMDGRREEDREIDKTKRDVVLLGE
eukprot:COSAG05_NODE_1016_length_6185_cov_4.604831_4_plen_63_part_00